MFFLLATSANLQLQVQMEHPEESDPIGVIVGHVFLAVFQLGMSEWRLGSWQQQGSWQASA